MLTSASPPTIQLPFTKCFVVKPARFYLEFVWAHSGGNGCFINRPGLHSPEHCEILQTLCSSRKPAGTKQHFLDCNISVFRRDCFGRIQNEFKQYLFPAEPHARRETPQSKHKRIRSVVCDSRLDLLTCLFSVWTESRSVERNEGFRH